MRTFWRWWYYGKMNASAATNQVSTSPLDESIDYEAPSSLTSNNGGQQGRGLCPSGTMDMKLLPHVDCPGFIPSTKIIQIMYTVPSGIQLPYHENPGNPFSGTNRVRMDCVLTFFFILYAIVCAIISLFWGSVSHIIYIDICSSPISRIIQKEDVCWSVSSRHGPLVTCLPLVHPWQLVKKILLLGQGSLTKPLYTVALLAGRTPTTNGTLQVVTIYWIHWVCPTRMPIQLLLFHHPWLVLTKQQY
jgi:hypothetical protein